MAYVMSDIHGEYKAYQELLKKIDFSLYEHISDFLLSHIVYIKHNNITPGTRTFKSNTKGTELVPEMKAVSDNIFTKTKSNALTVEFSATFALYEVLKRVPVVRCLVLGIKK